VDFWATWCVYCREAFPHLKEVYKAYKGDKFEMLGISVDLKKEVWLKTLETEQLPWLQVLDTKSVNKNNFLVEGYPTMYLLDPEGKVVLTEIGSSEKIEKKLKEIFSK